MTSRSWQRTTLSTGNRLRPASGAFVTLIVLLVMGCTTSPTRYQVHVPVERMNAYLENKPLPLHPVYRRVLREGKRNLVLNHLRAGLGAMYLNEQELAEDSFDKALASIETVYADDPTAKRARSLWYEEGMKDFKGEPYERAMAYYYRGLLYLKRGDFENARACFKSGVLQDAFAEEKQNQCDFALLVFLEGWASQCNGDQDLANAAYEAVKLLRPDFAPPDPDHNVLIIAETGKSPRKVSDGIGHCELKFRRGRYFEEQGSRITLGQRTYEAYPMEDIAWQAMTRGGRPVDKILHRQVHLGQTHEQIGTVLTDASSNAMLAAPLFEESTEEIQAFSAALGLIGVIEMAIASKVRAEADTRYWDNLPDAVHILTLELPTEEQTATVSFPDSSGSEIPGLGTEAKTDFPDGQFGIAWIRSRSALSTVQ